MGLGRFSGRLCGAVLPLGGYPEYTPHSVMKWRVAAVNANSPALKACVLTQVVEQKVISMERNWRRARGG